MYPPVPAHGSPSPRTKRSAGAFPKRSMRSNGPARRCAIFRRCAANVCPKRPISCTSAAGIPSGIAEALSRNHCLMQSLRIVCGQRWSYLCGSQWRGVSVSPTDSARWNRSEHGGLLPVNARFAPNRGRARASRSDLWFGKLVRRSQRPRSAAIARAVATGTAAARCSPMHRIRSSAAMC